MTTKPRDLAMLLNRAACALSAPNSLTENDKHKLVESLLLAAEDVWHWPLPSDDLA